MTTRKKGKSIPRSRVPAPKKVHLPPREPEDILMKKARKLPMFGPGITIDLKLAMLPGYFPLYQLEAMTPGEVRDTEERLGKRKPADVVWVKRVPKGTALPKNVSQSMADGKV